jgi:glyoxylase-like metal-dependent hydrolase (beta-lactamase superfamily II)
VRIVVTPVTPFEQNCALLWDPANGKGAVVDPGGDLDTIIAVAAKHSVTIEKILITHAHIDHAGGAAELARRLGVTIEGPHEGDRFWVDKLADQGRAYGFAGAAPFEPARWLIDGDTVKVGDLEFEVLHCPGHTPGHVVFYHRPSRFAFVGDVLFRGSIGRTDFPGGDHSALLRSIREHLFPLGDDVQFLPGHGPVSTFGDERRDNPFVSDTAVRRG